VDTSLKLGNLALIMCSAIGEGIYVIYVPPTFFFNYGSFEISIDAFRTVKDRASSFKSSIAEFACSKVMIARGNPMADC